MKNLLSIGLILLGTFPAYADASDREDQEILTKSWQWELARKKAIARIEREPNIRVVYQNSARHSYDDAPIKERWQAQHLGFEGENTANVLHSKAILAEAAKHIFDGCPFAGIVDFGQYQTSWGLTIGLNADQSLVFFKCAKEYNRFEREPITWGKTVCI